MPRTNQIRIFVGMMKTGKTYFLKNTIMKKWREIRTGRIDDRVLIIDAEDNIAYREYQIIKPAWFPQWKSGVKRIVLNEDLEFEELMDVLKDQQRGAWNMMLVFEDTTNYIDPRDLPKPFKKLIVNCKNRNLDVVFMFHNWNDAHRNIIGKADWLHLFYTGDTPENRKDVISLYNHVKQADDQVKADYRKNQNLPLSDARRYPRADIKLR